jgi:hypothetical protein
MAHIAVTNLLHALQHQQMPHCANPEIYQDTTWQQAGQDPHPDEPRP